MNNSWDNDGQSLLGRHFLLHTGKGGVEDCDGEEFACCLGTADIGKLDAVLIYAERERLGFGSNGVYWLRYPHFTKIKLVFQALVRIDC